MLPVCNLELSYLTDALKMLDRIGVDIGTTGCSDGTEVRGLSLTVALDPILESVPNDNEVLDEMPEAKL